MPLESFSTVVYALDSGIFFSRFTPLDPQCSIETVLSDVVIHYDGWSCVQGSGWFVPQVAVLHTWVGEDQCRVNPI